MRSYLMSGAAVLTLLILVMTACRDAAEPAANVPPAQTTGTATDDVRPTEDIASVSFRESLIQLDFGQSDDTLGYLFLSLTADELPRDPWTVVRHMDGEFSIGMKLEASREEVERLLAQVRVEGAGNHFYTNLDRFPDSPVLRMTDLLPETVVTLGDLPPITILKREPLGVTLEYEDPTTPTPGLFVHPSEDEWAQAVAIVPAGHPDLVLRFSEEMDRSPNPDLPAGEWIDAYRYRLHLPRPEATMRHERISTGGSLHAFRSSVGNYAFRHRDGFTVIQAKESDWLDPETGERVGWSENDPFYETIVYSPDGESYVGTAVVGWSEGDGIGSYYRLMLERKGAPAVVIEPYFYTGMLHLDSPVQWAGNDRVAYADFQSLYVYDVKNGARTTLFSVAGTKWHIHYAAYDPWAKQWNVLTATYDAPGAEDYGPYPIDLYLLDDDGNVISHHGEWSWTRLSEHRLVAHRIIPAKDGVYRSFPRDDKLFTRFEGRDGSMTELPGMIEYADDQRAVLIEYNEGDAVLYLWRPDRKRLTAAAEAPGDIRVPGPVPVAVSPAGDYYRYDAESDAWLHWESERTVSLPRHSYRGMYKK